MEAQTPDSAMQHLVLDDDALLRQCEVDRYRASGPGGQKRNKTSSAVRLRHGPTGLMVIAEEDRSQHVNKRRAVRRLREAIALNVRGSVDPDGEGPSVRISRAITAAGRLRVSQRNPDYYPIVCELLDVLHACGMRVRDAAKLVGVSTAALVGFLERDRKVWSCVNRMRRAAGIKPLR